MTYLVTGGWGFIGARIVRQLIEAGRSVVVLDVGEPGAAAQQVIGDALGKICRTRGDISDSLQVLSIVEEHRIDAIIHTAFAMEAADYRPAGTTGRSTLTRTSNEMAGELNLGLALRVNCGGMLNVLEAARLFKVRRVVYTSAVAAFGMQIGELHSERIGDRAVFAPDTMYGATKITNEVMASIYYDKFGVDSVGLRIAPTFGVGNPAPFTDFLRRVAVGETVNLADPNYINSYIYVDDCADAHVFASQAKPTRTRVFNLREGEYSHQDLLAAILRAYPSAQVSLTPGRGDGVPVPPMDADGVRHELGWRAPHSLDAGLLKIFNHLRRQAGMTPLA